MFVEQLETRLTPTAFTWVGGGRNFWETPANWAGGNGATNYPGWDGMHATTNDTVTYNNTANTLVCGMNNSHTVSTFTITGWGGQLRLNGPLTLANGGSMNTGEILNPGPIATLFFAFGTFTWSGGYINWDVAQPPQIGNVTIYSGAEVDVTGTGAGQGLGDNLTNNGTFKLANTNTLTLYNRPTITNNGTILVTGTGGSLLPASGDPVVTIQNTGTIQSTVAYTIGEAVNMAAASALLYVQQSTLNITGADPSAGYSLLVPTGTVQITAAAFPPGGATLHAKYGVQQTGGTTKTTIGSAGVAYIDADTKDYKLDGGTIQVGDTTPSTPKLSIKQGNLQFKSGTVQLYYDTNVPNGKWSQLVVVDSITITQASTTMAVTFLGTNLPNSFNSMYTVNGTINTTCGTNPTGYNASITGNQQYTLTKQGLSPFLVLSDFFTADRSGALRSYPKTALGRIVGCW